MITVPVKLNKVNNWVYNIHMTEETSKTDTCCAECICDNPHRSTPLEPAELTEENNYATDIKYTTETPEFCCDLCTCEIPHRSKPLE